MKEGYGSDGLPKLTLHITDEEWIIAKRYHKAGEQIKAEVCSILDIEELSKQHRAAARKNAERIRPRPYYGNSSGQICPGQRSGSYYGIKKPR